MTDNNMLSQPQHSSLKGIYFETQLRDTLADIIEVWDNRNDVDVIYLDFCMVFNKIPHLRQLTKFENIDYKAIYSTR